jgi:hypothetical protein
MHDPFARNMRIFAAEVLVVYRALEVSPTMNNLLLEFMDLIHAENLLSHDGQKFFNDATGDMLTISQIEFLPDMIIQKLIRYDSSKIHLRLWNAGENSKPVGPKSAVLR